MSYQDYDVLIVGYGPTGQTLSNLLGRMGHRVAVIERWPNIFPLPRAAVFDGEIMRIFQTLGITDLINDRLFPTKRVLGIGPQNETLFQVNLDESSHYCMYQPDVDNAMDQIIRTLPSVDLYQGWEAVDLTEDKESVSVKIQKMKQVRIGELEREDEFVTLRAKYVVGADGANSLVRKEIGTQLEDLGFEARWLVIDFKPNDPDMDIDNLWGVYQFINPQRPTTFIRRLGVEHVRFEFMLFPDESAEVMSTEETAWELVSKWLKPTDGDIIRRSVYTFRSKLASEYYRNRLIIAGDSAHLTPPFLGQGLCAGVRDAMNLGWKLDLILQGKADESLFKLYTLERKSHVRDIINTAIGVGKVICLQSENGSSLPKIESEQTIVDLLTLKQGVLYRDDQQVPILPAGLFSIQGNVSYEGKTGRFDDIIGRGWMIISSAPMPTNLLSSEQQAFLETLNARFAHVTSEDGSSAINDVEGAYTQFLKEHDLEVMVIRPDFYIFGGVASLKELPKLVDSLRGQLVNYESCYVNQPGSAEIEEKAVLIWEKAKV
jgi:2-polyprenyl-6-methoxyphenol hydroxylase-like FAD-dependent oxidoreductase